MSSDPHFPPEIEHTIFLYAFHNTPTHPLNLLLTFKRILHWLAPHVYHTVIIRFPSQTSHINLFRKYGGLMRHVLFEFLPNTFDTTSYLVYCPNLQSFFAWTSYFPLTQLCLPSSSGTASLRRLSASFLRIPHTLPPGLQTTLGMITHLDVMEIDVGRVLPLFKRLTHLAIEGLQADQRTILSILSRRSSSLKVLVLWFTLPSTASPTTTSQLYTFTSVTNHITDPRVVTIQRNRLADWVKAGSRASSGKDMWKIAEAEVVSKRSGRDA